jgi:hypothetical protein
MTRRLFYAIEFPEDIRRKLYSAGRELANFADRGVGQSRIIFI